MADELRNVPGVLHIRPTKKSREYRAGFTRNGKPADVVILDGVRCFDEKDAAEDAELRLDFDDKWQLKKAVIFGKPECSPQNRSPRPQGGGRGGQRQAAVQHASSNTAARQQPPLCDATAPYNFIPHDPAQILLAGADEGERFSGSIACRLTALTPLLVSGPRGRDGDETRDPSHRRFLEVEGRKVIPGSSLKGMLRSLVEVLAFAPLRPVNRNGMVFRDFTNETYKERIGSRKNSRDGGKSKDDYKTKAGWLKRTGAQCVIVPVDHDVVRPQPDYVPVKTGPCPPVKGQSATPNTYYFAPMDQSAGRPLAVPPRVMEAFREQLARSQSQKDMITDRESSEDLPKPLPVFYLAGDDGVEFLGLPKCFRLPYAYTVPDLLAGPKGRDFVSKLFGHVSSRDESGGEEPGALKGRVRVSACMLEDAGEFELPPLVLGRPQATCLAHYLVQENAKKKKSERNDPNTFSDYNDKNARPRGRKWYWHRDRREAESSWPTGNKNEKVTSILHPAAEGCRGDFTVRVRELTGEELGAVLEALQLPAGHAHKLGMGKPLGLGSVRLEVLETQLVPDAKAYRSLKSRFAARHPDALDRESLEQFRQDFKAHVLTQLKRTGEDYESLEPIRHLRVMMDFAGKPEASATDYMKLAPDKDNGDKKRTYRDKAILRDALEIASEARQDRRN